MLPLAARFAVSLPAILLTIVLQDQRTVQMDVNLGTVNVKVECNVTACSTCGCPVLIPEVLIQQQWREFRAGVDEEDVIDILCPNGHRIVFHPPTSDKYLITGAQVEALNAQFENLKAETLSLSRSREQLEAQLESLEAEIKAKAERVRGCRTSRSDSTATAK